MHPPRKKWPEHSRAQGTLIFAQLMREMLFDFSWDCFKVPALDTVHRLLEAQYIASEIQTKELNHKIIEPIKDEILWSLKNDYTAQIIFGNLFNSIVDQLSKCQSLIDLIGVINYSYDRLSLRYKKTCEDLLINLTENTEQNLKLHSVAKSYCSYLLNSGYSREYVKDCVLKTFFEKDFERISKATIQKFFRYFSEKDKIYSIYFKIDKRGTTSFDKFPKAFLFERNPDVSKHDISAHSSFFQTESEDVILKLEGFTSKDPYSARDESRKFLDIVQSAHLLISSNVRLRPNNRTYVIQQGKTRGELVRHAIAPLSRRRAVKKKEEKRNLEVLFSKIFAKNIDQDSTNILIGSLITSASAQLSRSHAHRC